MREKELLQEISAMGELGGEWKNKQLELLDAHLRLLRDYSQAKQSLQYHNGRGGKYFKPSAKRNDESLEPRMDWKPEEISKLIEVSVKMYLKTLD